MAESDKALADVISIAQTPSASNASSRGAAWANSAS